MSAKNVDRTTITSFTNCDHNNSSCSNNMNEMQLFAAKSEEYSKRISKLQEEYLLPLKEDVSDWLNRINVVQNLNTENFMYKLDNGVIVCKLAKLIEETCNPDLSGNNKNPGPVKNNRRNSTSSVLSSSS
ncbi:growth arrest-specific protein 2-like protein, partial [Dinothrombium tinctorium]